MTSDVVTDLYHTSVHRLACFLRARADDEAVRTLEALAAAISNRVRHLLAQQLAVASGGLPPAAVRAQLFLSIIEQMGGGAQMNPAWPDDPVFACCLRIARRAMNGALRDPTRGATGFRKLGDPLPEALDSEVGIWISSYVFFSERVEPSAQIPVNSAAVPLALV